VRVLIDYRPALRERSGSGEYTHQLAKALLAAFPAGTLELTLFASSWKDRFALPPDLAGAAAVDRRVPVSVLNFAWHRLGWPPAETLARSAFDVVHSPHPLLMPARRAAQVITIHDLDFLTHPERTRAEIRRDYPALARNHAHRAAAVLVPSAYTAGEVERLLDVPRDRMTICPPGAPDWTPRAAAPKDGYVLFFSTLEPRKNVGGLLDAYEQLLTGSGPALREPQGRPEQGRRAAKAGPTSEGKRLDGVPGEGAFEGARAFHPSVPELVLAGRATEDAQPWLDRIAQPSCAGTSVTSAASMPAIAGRVRRRTTAGITVVRRRLRPAGAGSDDAWRAGRRGRPRIAAGVLGDAGVLANPDRPADIARAIAQVLNDDGVAAACTDAGIARARTFRWEETAHRVYDTYRNAIERRARAPRRG
jgi:glycosyltransferase involved in cell wall biosynthesis